jgi:hypothetical protein
MTFVVLLLLLTPALYADVFVEQLPFSLRGTSSQPPGTEVVVTIDKHVARGVVASDGTWEVRIDQQLPTGTYEARIDIGGVVMTQLVRVQLKDNVRRQSPFAADEPRYGEPEQPNPNAAEEMTDRWRIVPPAYELDENPRARRVGTRGATLDPYNKNLLKGDLPIYGDDTFFVLTAISDTLAESHTVPIPSGVSTKRPGSVRFFGSDDLNVFRQDFIVSGDLYQGLTTFQPVRQRIKLTLIGNLNKVSAEENAIIKPDVRRGTERNDGHFAVQELFYERKLRDLSDNYDFLSIRVGRQPFSSDFRGFVFTDTNLGARAFGNLQSNRIQYNLAAFYRLEKDTNSGLNTMRKFRGQSVVVANAYIQDFFRKGYTQSFSMHYVHDEGGTHYDRNGILVRPAPVGDFSEHTIDALYLGQAGLGHFGRINVDHALYLVVGRDTLNPIAGRDPLLRDDDDVTIGAGMAALELSYDRDWIRPRLGFFYSTGDRNPRDRDARGFDSIFDAPAFAGGGFSFFNRLGIRLPGSGVALVERGSLLPSLRSGKDEGQPNYVNPGLQLLTAGVDLDLTPRLTTILTANAIRLDAPQAIEAVLFQNGIHNDLGIDLSAGFKYRPLLNNHWVVVLGGAAFIPGRGFEDIYEETHTLFHVFTNVTLAF